MKNPYEDAAYLAQSQALQGFRVDLLDDRALEFWRRQLAAAWLRGHNDRRRGLECKCPLSSYPNRAARLVWVEGWSAAHRELSGSGVVRDRVPDIHTQAPPVRGRKI